jgi:hypothetical protein
MRPAYSSHEAVSLSAPHAGAGGACSRAISDWIAANIYRDTATSAIWNVT